MFEVSRNHEHGHLDSCSWGWRGAGYFGPDADTSGWGQRGGAGQAKTPFKFNCFKRGWLWYTSVPLQVKVSSSNVISFFWKEMHQIIKLFSLRIFQHTILLYPGSIRSTPLTQDFKSVTSRMTWNIFRLGNHRESLTKPLFACRLLDLSHDMNLRWTPATYGWFVPFA